MLKICHRINTLEQLQTTPEDYGVEMDIHAYGNNLIVHHDALTEGLLFDDWLDAYHHKLVILNIKEEGIENRVRDMVLKRGIEDFFMLDLSFPALIKMTKAGEKRVAVRVSQYESPDCALMLSGLVEWIWLDMFTCDFPLNAQQYKLAKEAGQKICIVSPELHGRDKSEIALLKDIMAKNRYSMDAVCTKYPELW